MTLRLRQRASYFLQLKAARWLPFWLSTPSSLARKVGSNQMGGHNEACWPKIDHLAS